MKNLARVNFIALGLLAAYSAAEIKFDSHILFKEGSGSWGHMGVADMDNDGKLDFTAGTNKAGIYWFQNTGDITKGWKKHTIDPKPSGTCVGGEPYDVDGDGWVDYVTAGYWMKSSGDPVSGGFEKKLWNGGKKLPGDASGCHDIDLADIDGDGQKDVMNHSISWWKMPKKGEPMTESWPMTTIEKQSIWGGVSPKAWGDIDGDGDNDVVGIKVWYENADGKGKSWNKHTFTEWGKKGIYGWEFRTWVADYDGDGDLDITSSEGDAGTFGTAAWFQNVDGKGKEWKTYPLPFEGVAGDMHGCGGHDFDNDGDVDIFVGKNGKGEGNEWTIFENVDGKGTFKKHTPYKGFGAHESIYADWDGDGDVDIISKCWCGSPTFVLLENKTDPPKEVSVPEPSNKNPLSFRTLISQSGDKLEVVSNATGSYEVELYNTQGKMLAALTGNEQSGTTITLQGYENGIYVLLLKTLQGAVAKKLILSR